jgi:uncharacterized protein YkwD
VVGISRSTAYGRTIVLRARLALVVALLLAVPLGTADAQPAPAPRPDAHIRTPRQSAYSGNDVYNRTGAGQSRTARVGPRGLTRFYVQIQNDRQATDDIRVVGTRESGAFAVRYFLGARQVSPLVKAGTLVFSGMAPGAHRTLTVEVEARAGAAPGSQRKVVVSARSVTNGQIRDNVTATVKLPIYSSQQRRIADLINQSRRANGRAGAALQRQLTTKALAWAERLARQGYLSHSNLASGAPAGWRSLAENVGMGSSLSGIHQAFMSSRGHRSNILGNYNYIGTGYAVGHGRLWVVQEFMLR